MESKVDTSKLPTLEWHYKIMEEELRLKDPERPLLKVRYEYLEDMINMHQYKRIVEVGAGTGVPALYLLKNCPSIEEYIAIDPLWPASGSNQIPFPMDAFLSARPQNKFWQKFSLDAVQDVANESCDLVFLDHLAHIGPDVIAIQKEIQMWESKIRKNGILAGHDYCLPSHKFVVKAVQDYFYPRGVNLINENHIYGGMTDMTDFLWWRYV